MADLEQAKREYNQHHPVSRPSAGGRAKNNSGIPALFLGMIGAGTIAASTVSGGTARFSYAFAVLALITGLVTLGKPSSPAVLHRVLAAIGMALAVAGLVFAVVGR